MSRRPLRANDWGGDCRAQVVELFAYLDDELSPAQCRRIERHLAECACCAGFTDSLRQAIEICRAAGRTRLPDRVRALAQARAHALLESMAPAQERPPSASASTPPRRQARSAHRTAGAGHKRGRR